MFIRDLLAFRPEARAKHTITALGSSSIAKGDAFVAKIWGSGNGAGKGSVAKAPPRPKVYADYRGVYEDPNVDIVYIGTPHSLHRENCLDAISAGKHVLCEKPITINEREAREVVEAAREQGVFLMEGALWPSFRSDIRALATILVENRVLLTFLPRPAMWTRFVPLFDMLREEIVEKKVIGDTQRFFMDFGNKMPLDTLPPDSRLKDPKLGAGALLDIGVYTLTYASLIMGNFKVGAAHPQYRKVTASLDIVNGIDESNVVVLDYPTTAAGAGEQGTGSKTAICTSTFKYRSPQEFARIEGSTGEVVIFGPAGSVPTGYYIISGPQPGFGEPDTRTKHTYNVQKPEGTLGFFWEADAVAHDIANGRTENATMPLDESLRMMRLMDQIRYEAGLLYPQDSE